MLTKIIFETTQILDAYRKISHKKGIVILSSSDSKAFSRMFASGHHMPLISSPILHRRIHYHFFNYQ